jgi:hypothetical protein
MQEINKKVRENFLQSQSMEKLKMIHSEVIFSFLSPPEKLKIEEVVREKLGANTIRLTGPGMITTFLFKQFQSRPAEEL